MGSYNAFFAMVETKLSSQIFAALVELLGCYACDNFLDAFISQKFHNARNLPHSRINFWKNLFLDLFFRHVKLPSIDERFQIAAAYLPLEFTQQNATLIVDGII